MFYCIMLARKRKAKGTYETEKRPAQFEQVFLTGELHDFLKQFFQIFHTCILWISRSTCIIVSRIYKEV